MHAKHLPWNKRMKPFFIAHYPENFGVRSQIPPMMNDTGAEFNLLAFVHLPCSKTI